VVASAYRLPLGRMRSSEEVRRVGNRTCSSCGWPPQTRRIEVIETTNLQGAPHVEHERLLHRLRRRLPA
jgi:hypothetical protein